MAIWKRNLFVLWIGAFFTAASYSMVIPFLPMFLLQIGVHSHTEMWSGLLFSSAFLAGAISSPIWGSLGDRFGRKPMIIRAGLFLALIYSLTAFVTNPYEILGLRVMQGLLTGFIPGTIALIGTNTPREKVGYALAMISTATAAGGIIGPLLGGTIASFVGNREAFASAGIIVLLSTLLVIFLVKEEKFNPNKEKSSIIKDIQTAAANRPFFFVLFLVLVTQLSLMTIEPVLPLYIVKLGGGSKNTSFLAGIVFSLPGIASVIFGPIWGRLSDKWGFQKILFIGLLGGAIGTLLQMVFGTIIGFSIVRFIFGCFFCAVFPALNGLVVQSTPETFRGRAFGLSQTANQLGGMLGPMIGGFIGGMFPIEQVFLVTGLLLFVSLGLAHTNRKRWMKKSQKPVEQI